MNRRNYRKRSGIIIDVCRSCGTWLDADELEAIAGFILEGPPSASSAPEPDRAQRKAAVEFARFAVESENRSGSCLERNAPDSGTSWVDFLIGLLR